jgi:hypothetical protein
MRCRSRCYHRMQFQPTKTKEQIMREMNFLQAQLEAWEPSLQRARPWMDPAVLEAEKADNDAHLSRLMNGLTTEDLQRFRAQGFDPLTEYAALMARDAR